MMNRVKKRIAILGSTGSIGLNSIEVLDSLGDQYGLVAASCNSQWELLAQQARTYSLESVALTDSDHLADLKDALADTDTKVLSGPDSLVELAADDSCDTVVAAVVGAAQLPAVLAATAAGKTVAIANKESLVMAGCLLMPSAAEHSATVIPIDSEHSAIMQAMHAGARREVRKVIITGSGGPFRQMPTAEMLTVSLDEALNHPTWNMGPKISIDSATMMNKALEIVEARWLFDLEPDQIEVLVHPESIVHSMVEFCDGSVIAQMSPPDMRLPIQYALTYPKRLACPSKPLDLQHLGRLTFESPDLERFPAVRLGFEVARWGGTAGAVLNAANEAGVEAFMAGKIGLTEIAELAEHCLRTHDWTEKPSLEQLFQADRWAREHVAARLAQDDYESTRRHSRIRRPHERISNYD